MNNAITKTDKDSYMFIKKLYEEEYNELYDVLYHYMYAYINDHKFDCCLFADECENIMGIRNHEDIVTLILNLKDILEEEE